MTTTPSVEFVSATPNLLVSDMATSLAFYRDVLGFQLAEKFLTNRRSCSPG